MICPRPWQVGQVRSTEKKPWLARTRPEPWQVPQVFGCVPGLAPEPEQTSQVTAVGTGEQSDVGGGLAGEAVYELPLEAA